MRIGRWGMSWLWSARVSAAYDQLIAAGFRELPNKPDEALKRTLRQPIIGDCGLLAFLSGATDHESG